MPAVAVGSGAPASAVDKCGRLGSGAGRDTGGSGSPWPGITGNTHFLFSDLNNRQIARHIAAFLRKKRLD